MKSKTRKANSAEKTPRHRIKTRNTGPSVTLPESLVTFTGIQSIFAHGTFRLKGFRLTFTIQSWYLMPLPESPILFTLRCRSRRERPSHLSRKRRFDPISPLKPILGEKFLNLMEEMQKVIFAKYGVSWWTMDEKAKHKNADVLAAASEAMHVAGWSNDEVRSVLGIDVTPLVNDPLVAQYGGVPWEPWATDVANSRFLLELRKILNSRQDS